MRIYTGVCTNTGAIGLDYAVGNKQGERASRQPQYLEYLPGEGTHGEDQGLADAVVGLAGSKVNESTHHFPHFA